VAGGGEGEDDTDHSEESEDEGRPAAGVSSLSSPASLKRNVSMESMTHEGTSKRLRANPEADEDQSGDSPTPLLLPLAHLPRPHRALCSASVHDVRDETDGAAQRRVRSHQL
jgi:hypothetical protein